MTSDTIDIPVDRIHLFQRNPRHGFIADPEKIIDHLLENEQVYELARSIAEQGGTNPLQLIGVIRIDDEDDAGEPTYVVYEGNRRVCAIMLLNDPELAPVKWKARFEKLAQNIDTIETIEGKVFEDKKILRFWMANIHNRNQKGRGRKEWGPDEQHRFNPTKKYAIAFDLLEMAEELGYISASARKNRLTTLQRFVGTDAIKSILKADDTNPRPGKVKFGRPEKELKKLLKQLIADLLEEVKITSRKNEDDILAYAASLEERAGVPSSATEDEADGGSGQGDDDSAGDAGGGSGDDSGDDDDDDDDEDDDAPPPKKPFKIKPDKALGKEIAASKNDKLIDLYRSVTTVSARQHPQLVAVGCWSLIETIAKVCDAKEGQAFTAFFSRGVLQNDLGYAKGKTTTIQKALDHISKAGNLTKHDAVSATFDEMQLINDMETVSPMLAKALKTLG